MRTTLGVFLCSLLLSFNALAVTLLAIDQCMTNGDPAAYQMSEQAGMQMNIDCADTEQSWLSSTAQLLCDHGGNCQMGGVVVSSAAILPSVLPNHALPAFVRLGFNPAYPIAFWRPPRH